MSTTQIPSVNPASPTPGAPRPDGGDLYDARYWESAYRELHEAPTLLIQLQDDLSRSRRREAFWISVVVHLVVVLLIVNSQKLAKLMPRQTMVLMNPNVLPREKELTYLELPPDQQPVTKRPDTNIMSDKNRIATSKAPQLDRQELKKILDSSRPGMPGPAAPSGPEQQPSPPAAAQNMPAQTQGVPSSPAPPSQDITARLQTPPAGSPNPFSTGPKYAGSAIEQAARAAAANPGGYAGQGGNYGLGQGRKPTAAIGPLDVLSDTMGVDFGPYLQQVLYRVRTNWYNLIPESAKAPIMKKGKLSIEFAILKDGRLAGMKLAATSGDVALDRGAWGGVTASAPFPPLPSEFAGQFLALRFNFYYNPDPGEMQ